MCVHVNHNSLAIVLGYDDELALSMKKMASALHMPLSVNNLYETTLGQSTPPELIVARADYGDKSSSSGNGNGNRLVMSHVCLVHRNWTMYGGRRAHLKAMF